MDHTTATPEGFTAQCGCGKRYRVATEKRGRKLKCHACGGSYVAEPAPPRARTTPAEGHAIPAKTESSSEAATVAVLPTSPVKETLDAVARPGTPEPIDPAPLLQGVSRGNLPALIAVALAIHLVVIGLTSIGHISLCVKYGTLYPKPLIRKEREEEEKRKLEEKQAQQQKALAEKQAEESEKHAAKKNGTAGEKAEKPKSRIEQVIEEKSDERPKESSIRLDDPASLE